MNIMEEQEINAREFLIKNALLLAVKIHEKLESPEDVTSEDLRHLSEALLNVNDLLASFDPMDEFYDDEFYDEKAN